MTSKRPTILTAILLVPLAGYLVWPYVVARLDDARESAARRLLSLGARGDAPIGAEEMPLGLLVLIGGDIEGVKLLHRYGLDFAKIRFRGMTALDYAK